MRTCVLLALLAAACDAPVYLQPTQALEVNAGDMGAPSATYTLTLPVELESEDDLADREADATELGLALDQVPYVRLDDFSVSVEYTVKNLSEVEGQFVVATNGANEWFAYVPDLFIVDVEDDDVDPPPPLVRTPPTLIPGNGTVHGVLLEDELREAAIDLELITRGGLNPILATLEVHEDTEEMMDPAGGATYPASVFAGIIRLDLSFSANRHMVMEFTVRVRDHRGILHDELLGADPAELTAFMPADYAPPPPAMP